MSFCTRGMRCVEVRMRSVAQMSSELCLLLLNGELQPVCYSTAFPPLKYTLQRLVIISHVYNHFKFFRISIKFLLLKKHFGLFSSLINSCHRLPQSQHGKKIGFLRPE